MRAIRAIAVLLCAALLLPVFGCTTVEPTRNNFMSVEEIAETYPGVKLKKGGTDRSAKFKVDLSVTSSFAWMKHLTDMSTLELEIVNGSGTEELAMADLSGCKNLLKLTVSVKNAKELTIGELPNVAELDIYVERVGSVLFNSAPCLQQCEISGWGVGELDMSALSAGMMEYVELQGLKDCVIEYGDGAETMVFVANMPDISRVAELSKLKELQLLTNEPCDLTPLGSSESLHLLHLGIFDGSVTNYDYEVPADIEWDLSPIVGSNIDTVMLGSALPTPLIKDLEGAENIRHLQINRRGHLDGIETILTMPNLETVAVLNRLTGYYSAEEVAPDSRYFRQLAIKKDAQETLRSFIEGGGRLIGSPHMNFDDDTSDYWGRSAADNYYEWYYANVG